MTESEVIEIDGVFVGTAMSRDGRPEQAFFATHDRVRPMHGQVLPSLATLRQQAGRLFRGVPRAAEVIAGSRPD
ncbi:MAG: hypothetical protein INR65_06650 [Gluconacetobacter diazotrophicus]|nr:hypothetical protein [Gluconacetobacter diazotrophicus]